MDPINLYKNSICNQTSNSKCNQTSNKIKNLYLKIQNKIICRLHQAIITI